MFRSLALFVSVALGFMLGQSDFPGVFGPVSSRPKAGDLAPEITFKKVLHSPGDAQWESANLNGQITIVQFLPHVSGNLEAVNRWNELTTKFAGKAVQFIWVAREDESTLLPFIKAHPVNGWLFHDPDGATARAYGLEWPQAVVIGPERRIIGFDRGVGLEEDLINAVLDGRTTLSPPRKTLDSLQAFHDSGLVLLSPQARRMPMEEDHRPNFSPSYMVHIAPAQDPLGGGDYGGSDYWSLQGYTVPQILAQMLDLNPIRISLPSSINPRARYDVAIVLPQAEDREEERRIILRGVEDYFQINPSHENLLTDAYVVTAPDREPPASAVTADGITTGSFTYASGWTFHTPFSTLTDIADSQRSLDIDGVSSISFSGTVAAFCQFIEQDLNRPVVDETNLKGNFEFQVPEQEVPPGSPRSLNFVQRLRDQTGLVVTRAQRHVELIVYRSR